MTNNCECGHDVTNHYPLCYWMTGCKDNNCDCLDFVSTITLIHNDHAKPTYIQET